MADVVIPAEAPPAFLQRPRVLIVGTGLAAAASVMYFAATLGVYLQQRSSEISQGRAWLPTGVEIPLSQPNMMFLTLLLSVFTVHWAASAARNDDRVHLYVALGVTLLFGFAVLNQASYLYNVMGVKIEGGAYGVLLYAVTGGHLAMLAASMLFLAVTAFRALGGQETSRQHDGVSAAALYWDVMVLVFGIIWIAIYVTK